tara:strand:- start:775 stop:1755 length:981 start_codon:yes stop_codon:yes gene_type:complete
MINKKTIGFLLKILIVSTCLGFLYNQISSKILLDQFNYIEILSKIKEHYLLIIVVLIMMPFNWLIEAFKWRFLIAKIERVNLLRSLQAVFSGITVSIFTPNRIGEYGGRVFCLEKGDRIQAVLITIIGSVSQFIITFLFGSIGVSYCLLVYSEVISFLSLQQQNIIYYIILLTLMNILVLYYFFNFSLLSEFFSKRRLFAKFNKYSTVFKFYKYKELLVVLLLSFFRYLVFSIQFFILFSVFDIDLSYLDALILIPTMFFLVSVIPSIAVADISIRSTVAILLFGLVTDNIFGILSTTFLLWIINLIIPALIGTIFIFTLKFFRKS